MEEGMTLVLFVCNGNIHRSAIAKQIFLKLTKVLGVEEKIRARSRGLKGFMPGTSLPRFPNLTHYEEAWRVSKPTLDGLGISEGMAEHKAKSISPEDMVLTDIVVPMNTDIEASLRDAFPEHAHKIRPFVHAEGVGVPDMVENFGERENRIAILTIYQGVASLVSQLVRK
jgi:protein-tyrosine-phosphatase